MASDPEHVPSADRAGATVVLPQSPSSYVVDHRFHDMSETAARALEQVAKYTHAVPARQQSLRLAMVVGTVGAGAAFLAWMIYRTIDGGRGELVTPLVVAFVAVLGILGAGPVIDTLLKRLSRLSGD